MPPCCCSCRMARRQPAAPALQSPRTTPRSFRDRHRAPRRVRAWARLRWQSSVARARPSGSLSPLAQGRLLPVRTARRQRRARRAATCRRGRAAAPGPVRVAPRGPVRAARPTMVRATPLPARSAARPRARAVPRVSGLWPPARQALSPRRMSSPTVSRCRSRATTSSTATLIRASITRLPVARRCTRWVTA